MKTYIVALASFLLLSGVILPQAQQKAVAAEVIVDPSFELGMLDVVGTSTPGWKTDSFSLAIFYAEERSDPTFALSGETFSATNGKRYLRLNSGFPVTEVSQTINFQGTGTLELEVFVVSLRDAADENDDLVQIQLGGNVLYSRSTSDLGLLGFEGWKPLSFLVTGAGEQDIVFRSSSLGVNSGQMLFGIEGLSFTPTAVPLPGGLILLMSAMLTVPFLRKKEHA